MKLNVLIVDDLPDIRVLVKSMLTSSFQCAVIEADSGQAASLELSKIRFNLVISDLEMENGTGTWLYHQMREHFPEIPLIILTANPNSVDLPPDNTLRAVFAKDRIYGLYCFIKENGLLS